MRRMLKTAKAYAAGIGCDFLILIPADPELRAAYRRMGFETELPLNADAKGERFYMHLPAAQNTLPFYGDTASLYLKTDRRLPFSAFSASLMSVEGEIILTNDGGWRLCDKNDPTLCFACDRESEKTALLSSEETAPSFPPSAWRQVPPLPPPPPLLLKATASQAGIRTLPMCKKI